MKNREAEKKWKTRVIRFNKQKKFKFHLSFHTFLYRLSQICLKNFTFFEQNLDFFFKLKFIKKLSLKNFEKGNIFI